MNSLIMGAIFLAAIFGPVGYLIFKGKQRSNKSRSKLKQLVTQNFYKITEEEIWNDKILALDETQKVLIFINTSAENESQQLVQLSNVQSCRSVIDQTKIQIQLQLKSQTAPATLNIELYDSEKDDPTEKGFHIQIANKWTEKIKSNCGPGLKPVKAA